MNTENFQKILEEILVSETYLGGLRQNPDSLKKLAMDNYAKIADKHNIKLEDLYASIDYYTTQPKLLEKITASTIDSLNTLLLKYGKKE